MLAQIINKFFRKQEKAGAGSQPHEYEMDLSYSFATGNIARKPLEIPTGMRFPELFLTNRKETIIGVNKDAKELIKIGLRKNPRKSLDIMDEYALLQKLGTLGCVSSPAVVEAGMLDVSMLRDVVGDEFLGAAGERMQIYYLVERFIETAPKMRFADLIAAMLEQKSLGIYHGDIKPANIRFDEARGVCIFVDYDHAEELPDEIASMNAADFFAWCDQHEKEKYQGEFDTWRRHFDNLDFEKHIAPMLRDGAFNLAFTTPYRRQATTNTDNGVYHTINSPVVFADGVRDLKDRAALLDRVQFAPGEKVLDVGCNAGLLCHYLFSRGCKPTGIDMDTHIIVSAEMVANILGIKADFIALDIDNADLPGKFDTICLFSVIHHTQKVEENGQKIAKGCRRILIECRLTEHGRKPIHTQNGNVKWTDASVWSYPDEASLFQGLEKLFPGFVVSQKVGNADKHRILLELIKL